MRIERVVEIEYPGLDVAETTRGEAGRFGTTLLFLETYGRCRLVAEIDDRKAGGIQPSRRTILVVGNFEAPIAGAKRNRAAP